MHSNDPVQGAAHAVKPVVLIFWVVINRSPLRTDSMLMFFHPYDFRINARVYRREAVGHDALVVIDAFPLKKYILLVRITHGIVCGCFYRGLFTALYCFDKRRNLRALKIRFVKHLGSSVKHVDEVFIG